MSEDIEVLKLKKLHIGYIFKWLNCPLVPNEKRQVKKLLTLMLDEGQGFDEDRTTILNKWCDKKDDKPDTEDGHYKFTQIKDEDKKTMEKELEDLMNAEVKFDILPTMVGVLAIARSHIAEPKDEKGELIKFGSTPDDVQASIIWEQVMDEFDRILA